VEPLAARPYRRLAGWANARPLAVDVGFAIVVGVLTLLGQAFAERTGSQRPTDVFAVALTVGRAVALAFRRKRAMWSLAIVTVLTLAYWIADYVSGFEVFSLLSVYAATAHGGTDRRRVWRYVGAAVVAMTIVAVIGVIVPGEDLPAIAVLGIAGVHVCAAIVGEIVFDRRLRLERLETRMRQAETERELMAREAVLAERARIARDLHDIIAHGVSVMVVQAGAAERLVVTQPTRAATALADIQTTGRQALGELRRLLGVLRSDAEATSLALAPQPRLADLDALVRQCSDVGYPTELVVDGTPPPADLSSAGTEVVAYRVVQESLTNVVRHAGPGARASVRVTYSAGAVRIEVDDSGLGSHVGEVEASTGHGLLGMRERVELYGGRFRAGPRPGGGFRVAVTLPLGSDKPAERPNADERPEPADRTTADRTSTVTWGGRA
jgi:signal transduction histidine kinase